MSPARFFLERLATTSPGRWVAHELVTRAHATMVGDAHLPRAGGALLVGNHALGGVDAFPLAALVALRTGRLPRFLGDRNLWRIPGLSVLLGAAGAIPGAPDAAVRLLAAGEIVGVYPGGIDDSFKLSSEAYTLKWGVRSGFARVAMQARVPILPIAATGIDELFEVRRREHHLGRWFGGAPRYDVPIPENLVPRAVPLVYHVLAPVDTAGDPGDPVAVERVRRATVEAMESVLAPYRQRLLG